MGKMPLAGLIGACGIGILLTGCNCCKQDTNKQPYGGGRADASMGFTNKFNKTPPSTPLASGTGATGNPAGLSSASAAGGGFNSSSIGATSSWGGSSSNADLVSGGIAAPNNGAMPSPMNGIASPTPSSGLGAPVNSAVPSMASNGNSMMSGAGSSLAASGPYGNLSGSNNIRQVSAGLGDSTSSTAVHSANYDTNAAMPNNSASSSIVPPTPAMSMASMPPPPSSSPSSALSGANSDPALNAAVPSVSATSLSSSSGLGAKKATGSSNAIKPPFDQ